MMKNFVWSMIHPVSFHKKVKTCWGFCLQQDVFYERPSTKITIKDMDEFTIGVKRGYYKIYQTFYEKENFLNYCYTTPKLSFALNSIREHSDLSRPSLDFNSMNVEILNYKVEYGLVKSNEKILGLWTPKCIQQEIMIGMVGPEYPSIWTYQPSRQIINVLYEFPNRKDVWTWQCCNVEDDNFFWNVKNINSILL